MNPLLHILILEDNPADAEIVERLLVKEMVYVRFSIAVNKKEFLDCLDKTRPDVILADNSLPQFNATEALLILHNRSLRIPFILVTGTVSEEFAAVIIKLGAHDYILKDRLARLPSAIDAAIKQCKSDNEKLEAHFKLIQSEERYRTLLDRVKDGFIAFDINWRITYINPQAGIIAHRDPKSLIGKIVWEEFPDLVATSTYHEFLLSMKEQRSVQITNYYAPYDSWQENYLYPSPEGLSLFIRDITIKKKAEDEILQVNRELRELSSHLQSVREQERIHIAREIHDELGQQLTGLKMDMLWLQKRLILGNPAIEDKINGSVNLINEIVKSVRRISSSLRPSMLDDLGLVAALEWHAQEVERRSEIKVHFHSNIAELQLPMETSTGIFRIYQEVLTNAVRHANAHEITSSLSFATDHLNLAIEDDGKGMDLNASAQGKTLGLLGIKERTFILGGSFAIDSSPGKGTRVQISIPYQPSILND